MRTRSRLPLTLATALSLLAMLALSGPALAAETILTADLAGDAATDADGTGSAKITLDPDAGTACWELTVENIEPVTQSHIHIGAEGESGDVVVPLDVDGFEGTSEGCVEDQDAATLQAIIDDQSGYYVNIHTADFPGGSDPWPAGRRFRAAQHRSAGERWLAGAARGDPARACRGHRPADVAPGRDARLTVSDPERSGSRRGPLVQPPVTAPERCAIHHSGAWLASPVAPGGARCPHRTRAT